ncbi:S-adenosyl-L-methionine-dependent methyltransferase [Hypoxylon cercidicola]|nr:S-adenosyl-L-methionine-dependent methyltransferase [Hypoxylon cercidicola]
MENLEKTSADFIATAQSVLASDNEDARKQMFGVALQAMAMLESPLDTVWRTIMSPHAPSALMALIKAGVIQEIAKSESPLSADHLATVSGADKLLIVRLLRPLNALGFVQETSREEYGPTAITKALQDRALLGGFQFMFSSSTRSLANMPFYLEKTGFKNVEDTPGPFQDTHRPANDENFNAFMTGQRADRKQWFEFLDVHGILLKGAKAEPNATLLVDIGGGEGHDISEFYKRYPDAPGKLILQDLPEVTDSIQELPPKIERQKHDIFQRQPIKGARCYYFRSIFHNWPDADCIKILKRIAEAMTPGYSKLLLSKFVLPASNAPLYPALLDIEMMCVLSGMERTEDQFRKLLDAAGLKESPGPGHVTPYYIDNAPVLLVDPISKLTLKLITLASYQSLRCLDVTHMVILVALLNPQATP